MPSGHICASVEDRIAGFKCRGLALHEFTPTPGLHSSAWAHEENRATQFNCQEQEATVTCPQWQLSRARWRQSFSTLCTIRCSWAMRRGQYPDGPCLRGSGWPVPSKGKRPVALISLLMRSKVLRSVRCRWRQSSLACPEKMIFARSVPVLCHHRIQVQLWIPEVFQRFADSSGDKPFLQEHGSLERDHHD